MYLSKHKKTHESRNDFSVIGILGLFVFISSKIFTIFSDYGGSSNIIYSTYGTFNFIISFCAVIGLLLFGLFLYTEAQKRDTQIKKLFIIALLIPGALVVNVTYSFAKDTYHLISGSHKTISGKADVSRTGKIVTIKFSSITFKLMSTIYPAYTTYQINKLEEISNLTIKYYNENTVLYIEDNR